MNINEREKLFREEFVELYSELEYNVLLVKIAEKVKNYLNCEGASFFLYDRLKEELYFETATGEKSDLLKSIVLKKGEGIAGWIAETGKAALVNNCEKDSRFNSATDIKTDFITKSMLGVPVIRDGRLLGVLEAVNKLNGNFNENDLSMLKYISGFIIEPMHNALLYKKLNRETQNKDQLLELAKAISSSQRPEDVFDILKNILISLIEVEEITVFVNSEKKTYNLISENIENKGNGNNDITKTTVGNRSAIYPLRTRKKTIGFMEIKSKEKISTEMSYIIKGIAVFAAISIEKFELYSQIIEKEKIEKELQIARDIQQSFLLKEDVNIDNTDVSYINITSSEVGGDYYDIVKLSDKKTVYTINDISGHGVPASLLMAIFRTNFTYLIKKNGDILKTISEINKLIAETTDPNLYVTSFTATVDTDKMIMTYINSGHNSPFIIRGSDIVYLDEGTLVLGMFPEVLYECKEINLAKNDIIILYTDGVIEAENKNDEQFSLEKLIEIIRRNKEKETKMIKKEVIRELKEFTGGEYFTDDVTFMIIKL